MENRGGIEGRQNEVTGNGGGLENDGRECEWRNEEKRGWHLHRRRVHS